MYISLGCGWWHEVSEIQICAARSRLRRSRKLSATLLASKHNAVCAGRRNCDQMYILETRPDNSTEVIDSFYYCAVALHGCMPVVDWCVQRCLFVHALTMLMRSLTLVATSYPDPSAPW
jgi:hypothetical protein